MSPLLLLLLSLACRPLENDTNKPPRDTSDTSTDSGTPETADTATDGCQGNGDGTIDFSEFVAEPALGITAIYTTNIAGTTVPVPDLDGVLQRDGSTLWDFSATDAETDTQWSVILHSPQDAWFGADFPEATYYVGLDASEQMFGLYEVDPASERLLLLGMASARQGEALLRYTEPVVVFSFPISLGGSWESRRVEARGTYDGVEYPADYGLAGTVSLHHTYAFNADMAGVVATPLGSFDVLRLALHQEMAADNSYYGNVETVTQEAFFFVTECTGLVARVRSVENESSPDFHEATEYMRLGF